ncbi:MAG: hypothetical protein J3Q66DRAFT_346414 [Benniella sp.]|nr:MAG: hypothetical protein J3Q66DRAFT_346414 [Benniella sp.]
MTWVVCLVVYPQRCRSILEVLSEVAVCLRLLRLVPLGSLISTACGMLQHSRKTPFTNPLCYFMYIELASSSIAANPAIPTLPNCENERRSRIFGRMYEMSCSW